mgnify:CR=1 FL=1
MGVLLVLVLLSVSAPLTAAEEASGIEPIKCWWRTDKTSVRMGEIFSLALTCRLTEAEKAKTILAESALEVGALSLSPYEIVSGELHRDLKEGIFRFVQYEYVLRIVGEDFFGKETAIPPLDLHYKIEYRAGDASGKSASRDETYRLPALPIKVQSLVPKEAEDIRDYHGLATVGRARQRELAAMAAFAIAGILALLALIAVLVGVVGMVRGLKTASSSGAGLSGVVLLRKLQRVLKKIRRLRKSELWNVELVGEAAAVLQIKRLRKSEPWDDELLVRAMSVLRVAAALALRREVSQSLVSARERGLEGQVKLRQGLFPPRKVLVSANVTPEDVKSALEGMTGLRGGRRLAASVIAIALSGFNDARYRGLTAESFKRLDEALDLGITAVSILRGDGFWLNRAVAAVLGTAVRWREEWKQSRRF